MSDSSDRDLFENYWLGLKLAGDSLTKKAQRLLSSSAPENSQEVVYEDFYEVPIGPLISKPLNLDPTIEGNNYIIRPINVILNEPSYDSGYNPTFNDMIEISAEDYYKIRSVGNGCYVVINVNNTSVSDRFMTVNNLLSSEEDVSSDRYYAPDSLTDMSKSRYMIVVDGNLSYIGNNSFTIYLTTGKAYDIDSWIITIPTLQTHITSGYPVEFSLNTDYTINENILEFNNDIFKINNINTTDVILYCPKTPIVEYFLYDMYGTMINIPDWSAYNHNDSYSGKTAISVIMNSLQNGSNAIDYCKALNVYYGMPIAPKDSRILGLYESYSYTITGINGNTITVLIQIGATLHPFIQSGSRFLIEGKKEAVVEYVIDRTLGTINIVDASYLSIGNNLNVRLNNKFVIKDIVAETETENAYVTVYTKEGPFAINHLITTINTLSNGLKYPEIIIYNTENLSCDYNGIYHIVNAEAIIDDYGLVKLTIYKKPSISEPLYNDYIGTSMFSNENDIVHGYVHIPWPTHKFLYMLMDGNQYYKAYLDSPIDSIYDEGDNVVKYQILARNVSVFNKIMFPDWNQFDNFKKYNGMNFESDVLEATRSIPGGNFGSYFPSNVI